MKPSIFLRPSVCCCWFSLPGAPAASADTLCWCLATPLLPQVPTHWGSGAKVDETSILAIGRAAEAQ